MEYNSDIMVSIVCDAYNHEKYIADALEGFVMQKTNFAFEILVHDDASIDRTAEIIRDYEKRYPNLIKPIYETENQYSKQDGSLARIQFGRVKGKYTALCEGDDYWTDPLKLQKQFDAMERNPQIDMCAHKAKRFDVQRNRMLKSFPPINDTRVLTPEEVIYGGGGLFATCSLFYRSTINQNPAGFRKFWTIDYTLQINGALRGGILFLNDEMSVYRYGTSGSWTERVRGNVGIRMELRDKQNEMLDILNEDTNGRFAEIVSKKRRKNEWTRLNFTDRHKEMLNEAYRDLIRELPAGKRAKLYIKAWFPWMLALKRRIEKYK